MQQLFTRLIPLLLLTSTALGADRVPVIAGPDHLLERTCFQTGRDFHPRINLRSDVAIVYGIDTGLPDRIRSWRDRGYRIHVMTGVSWGNYQDYLYGRWDGINHEDEAQTERDGKKISHGGDVYYMCPGVRFGEFLSVGVQRALDAGAEAIHMEEPEFWVRGGYSDGFKRAWRSHYQEDWLAPHSSVDAQWRASKLKYDLYREALQQVFDHILEFNRRTGKEVRCYVPTHSLLNYAHWRIVSPESSLARLDGCDGYIAQVWTGTSRTPNMYRGKLAERTFETAFLEYGAMQNLVRATGRRVWYLNDPVEDNPRHDWEDYRTNWESTLVASLLQPEVWRYEVMPWPNRIFNGRYPDPNNPEQRIPIPEDYATEVQTVIHALNDMNQKPVVWDGNNPKVGVVVSDSLMFQRGDPTPSDPHLSHVYGLALPLLKRGLVVEPVQLENVTLPDYLADQQVLLMSYEGQKPLEPGVHAALANWVRGGGTLLFWDDDKDPYHRVRAWWNESDREYATPREHLFEQLGLARDAAPGQHSAGQGRVVWHSTSPSFLARQEDGDATLFEALKLATRNTPIEFTPANFIHLQRGIYHIAAGLEESVDAPTKVLRGRFVNLFDPRLELRTEVSLSPGTRWFLLDIERALSTTDATVLAASGKTQVVERGAGRWRLLVEGIEDTQCVVLLRVPKKPESVSLAGATVEDIRHDAAHGLLWMRFTQKAMARELTLTFASSSSGQ